MSSARFASITSSLLARKGEAMPWNQNQPHQPQNQDMEKIPLSWREPVLPPPVVTQAPRPAAALPPAPPPPSKDRSCSIRMSAHDYERLGILAVKAGATRQQLLKDALAQFLASQATHFSCACLGKGEACGNNCGPHA
jgi:hypothetical protein